MKRSSSLSSFSKVPDSPLPISRSRSCLQLRSLSSALPAPSSSFPEVDPTPPAVSIDINDSDVESDDTLWNLYERCMTHSEVSRSLDEKHKRFASFKENVKYIHLENKGDNYPYKLELNKYSEMTIEEFESKHTLVGFQHLDAHDSDVVSDETLWDLYERWMLHYEVSRSPEEKSKGFAAFKLQVKYIHLANKRDNIPYKLGLNRFSDLTRDEFVSKYMGGVSPAKLISFYHAIKEIGGILSEEDYDQGKMDGPRVTLDGYGVVPPPPPTTRRLCERRFLSILSAPLLILEGCFQEL